ncbi:MAG: hydantoinase/carbamoylase family amidase, partial [Tissierellia bacterium]|nr:hydantoinase/carbamoylase family amidase [Tissierellia bacterium]
KKTILMGSHLDTVPEGGLYDGALGFSMGVNCLKGLLDQNIKFNYNIEVIGFNAEEGGAMGGTFGSRAMMGLIPVEKLSLEDLKSVKLTKKDILDAYVDNKKYLCYIEPHIEQGNLLHNKQIPIGIVSGIVGISRFILEVNGEANHSGTTIMTHRDDALYKMSKVITYIHEYAKAQTNRLVATVGEISISPGSVNVIPGYCKCILEVRHMETTSIDDFVENIKHYVNVNYKIDLKVQKYVEKKSTKCDKKLMDLLEHICIKENIKYEIMPSGAGHDANAIGHKIPASMIFLPSIDGISHNKLEKTDEKDILLGDKLLINLIKEINNGGYKNEY